MYRVKETFRDNDGKIYKKNDEYKGSKERIEQLSTKNNKEGRPFIVKIEEKTIAEEAGAKHVGGGWYELPNGERVKGKDNANKALAEMK